MRWVKHVCRLDRCIPYVRYHEKRADPHSLDHSFGSVLHIFSAFMSSLLSDSISNQC